MAQRSGLQQRLLLDVFAALELDLGHVGKLGQAAPDHFRDQFEAWEHGNIVRSHQLPIPEDRDPVHHFVELIDEMGDKNYADPLVLELPHHFEELVGLAGVKAGSGFIEDQNLGRGDFHRARNGHHLLDCHGIGPQRLGHVDVDIQALEVLPRRLVHGLPVDAAKAVRLPADQDIL